MKNFYNVYKETQSNKTYDFENVGKAKMTERETSLIKFVFRAIQITVNEYTNDAFANLSMYCGAEDVLALKNA